LVENEVTGIRLAVKGMSALWATLRPVADREHLHLDPLAGECGGIINHRLHHADGTDAG
jgi:hypothetical protein